LEGRPLAERIASLMLAKKADHVLIMDLHGITTMTDYFVLGSADSELQINAIMKHVVEQLEQESARPWHIEGTNASSWVLLDFVDVVVHLFKPETRAFYSLERLWGDAEFIEIKDENEAP